MGLFSISIKRLFFVEVLKLKHARDVNHSPSVSFGWGTLVAGIAVDFEE